MEDQIRHFGQTPAQLFRRRHARRGPPPPPTAAPLLNGPDAFRLTVVGRPPADRCAARLKWGPWGEAGEPGGTGGGGGGGDGDRELTC